MSVAVASRNDGSAIEGFSLSLALHSGLLLIFFFGLPYLMPEQMDPLPTAMTVEIVSVSEFTNLKSSQKPVKKEPPKEKVATTKKAVPKTIQEVSQPEPEKIPEPIPAPPEEKKEVKPIPKEKPKPKKETKKEKPKEDDFAVLMSKLKQEAEQEDDKTKKTKKESSDTSRSDKRYDDSLPLSISERDLIRSQFQKCWRMPAGARNDYTLIVTLRAEFRQDGSVIAVDLIPNQRGRYNSDNFFRAAVDSAIRAVWNCSPLRGLPANKYGTWRDMELNFNPQDLLY